MENTINCLAIEKQSELIKGGQRGQIMAVGQKYGFDFPFIGIAPIPEEPVYIPGWWIIPAIQDQSKVPARSFQRIKLLFAEGVRPKSFVVVHEAPLALQPPRTPKPAIPKIPFSPQKTDPITGYASGTLMAGLLLGFSILSLPLLLLASAAMIDPILIAITEEHEWIEIDRWKIESR